MDNTQNKTELVATKVTLESKRIFDRIAKRMGINGYSLLSLMVSSFIKYADSSRQLDPDLQKLIDIYDNFVNWDRMSSIAGVGKRDVLKAIYLVSEDKKRNLNALLVDSPFFEKTRCTWNVQQVVDEVLQHATPRLYKRLKQIGSEMECNSTLETISELAERFGPDPDADYIRELFSDCARSEYGRDTRMTKYKRKPNTHQMDLFDTNPNTRTGDE